MWKVLQSLAVGTYAFVVCGFVFSAAGQELSNSQKGDPCFQASSSTPDLVIQLCSSFLARQPSRALSERALNRRGLAYYRTNRHREALADFNALIASNPAAAGYVDNRRAVFQSLGQLENALADANAAVHLAPQRAFVYHGRAGVYFDMRRYEAAVEDYTMAYQLPEKSSFLHSLYDRGRAHSKLRRFEKAISDFSSVIQIDPNFTYALRERALAQLELGRTALAELDLEAFLQREANDPDALAALSRIRSKASHGYASANREETKETPTPSTSSASLGTAFFVSKAGQLLTNAHVVSECTSVSVSPPGVSGWVSAQVLAKDRNNDLALLRVSVDPMPKPPLFRRNVRLGEDVAVFGFPLTGLVASSGNFTKGSITALAGLQDDTTKMQLAAPIQPGNSGGPVLDQTGAVIGVVVGKLNALMVAKATGNIPEQINFAIKANTALGFLEANGVSVAEAEKGGALLNGPDLADHARQFTVLVGCLRE